MNAGPPGCRPNGAGNLRRAARSDGTGGKGGKHGHHQNDLLALSFEGLDHMVRHPQDIYIQENGGQLQSIEVIGNAGARHIIRLRQPVPLPV